MKLQTSAANSFIIVLIDNYTKKGVRLRLLICGFYDTM